jgi:uncharacterized protein (UPF0548 family)
MAHITVEAEGDGTYRVTVAEDGSATTHLVDASRETVAGLGAGTTPEALVEASFRFLLDREPKESIMASFDITVISRYFPEYEAAIGDYL